MKKFRVTKILGGEIVVSDGDNFLRCVKSGNIKKYEKLRVGDFVEVVENGFVKDEYIIDNILPRKNALVRPNVANVDCLIIVLSILPPPDFFLVDNLILYCLSHDIIPVIVVNKCDIISSDQLSKLLSQYENVVDDIFVVSAKDNVGLDVFKNFLKGKFSALAGQSAVGKSSLINAIFPDINIESNDLSLKISRGKHTTRHNEVYITDDIMLVDTPGFSMFDASDIKPDELHNFYPDFADFEENCKFGGCTHINSTSLNCGVVQACESGQICLERYERYCKIYNDLKNVWRDKYD